MDRLIVRLYYDLRPNDGWLPLVILVAIASTLTSAVLEANWIPEDSVIVWTIFLGLILGIILAKRPLSAFPASLLFISYGVAITIINLAQLRPSISILLEGSGSALTYIRQNLFLFDDRIAGWLQSVTSGGSSDETIVFGIALGLISWFIITYLVWATYRSHNPLNALVIAGIGLGFNALYGGTSAWTLAVFIGLAALLLANIHMVDMQDLWDRRIVDYPSGINIELILTGGGIALVLLAVSFVVPAVNIRAIRNLLLEQQSVQQAEQALERAFGGVNISPSFQLEQELERSGSRGGDMPRSFLLGNPPELSERLVMTTTVQIVDQGETSNIDIGHPVHWRSFSYDIYTGRGWLVSSERTEDFAAGERLPVPPIESPIILNQTIYWNIGSTRTRYTLGLPLRFDQYVTAHWRGLSDLTQVRGGGSVYSAESQTSGATADELRQTSLNNIPETILARYTALPEGIPPRVYDLAQEAAGNATNPYDQVKAIESFLRQYPYSLDVNLPPANQDLVDYFLFDLQTGYCDYYAASMVVMARSLGIPARFATGFLAQPPDANGVQHIFGINAHSWAEVYFADYGWVEFEPTAAFPSQSLLGDSPEFLTGSPDFPQGEVIELPPPPEQERPSILTNPNFLLVLILFLAAVGLMIWLAVGSQTEPDSVRRAYGRLQNSANRIGQPTPQSQTPIEFGSDFSRRLNEMAKKSNLVGRLTKAQTDPVKKRPALSEEALQLANLFMARQYRRPDTIEEENDDSHTAGIIWQRIRLRLWLLALFSKLMKR